MAPIYLDITTVLYQLVGLPFQRRSAIGFVTALLFHFTFQRLLYGMTKGHACLAPAGAVLPADDRYAVWPHCALSRSARLRWLRAHPARLLNGPCAARGIVAHEAACRGARHLCMLEQSRSAGRSAAAEARVMRP